VEGHYISAVAAFGIDAMLDQVIELLAEAEQTADAGEEVVDVETIPVVRPSRLSRGAEVHKNRGGYVVKAPVAERIAAMVDVSNWNAVVQLHDQLRKLGVTAALDRAGVGPGDKVKIGKLEITWG
jgi:Obg family GTPase CgtA-like protein